VFCLYFVGQFLQVILIMMEIKTLLWVPLVTVI